MSIEIEFPNVQEFRRFVKQNNLTAKLDDSGERTGIIRKDEVLVGSYSYTVITEGCWICTFRVEYSR